LEVKDAIDINEDDIKNISYRTDLYSIDNYNKIMLLLRKTEVLKSKEYRNVFSKKFNLVSLVFRIQGLNCWIKRIARPEFD